MDNVYNGSSGKRSHSYYDSDENERAGRQKRRTTSNADQSAPSSLDTEYRILCPASRIGSIIGKGGHIIKSLRQEARSKIKVEDPVPGSDERVIYICSSAKSGKDKRRDRERNGDNEEFMCAAQEALFRVHERIIDGQGGASDEDDDEPPKVVTARLLVPNNQVGCLIGKGGKIIEQMRRDIGGQIRVLPKEQLPVCALPDDEIVQLSGDSATVRKALYAVSSRLHENPRERNQTDLSYQQGPPLPSGNSLFSPLNLRGSLLTPASAGPPMIGLGHSAPLGGLGSTGVGNAWPLSSSLPSLGGSHVRTESGPVEEFVIRVLCPNEKIGSMIGKGGNAIRKLREETGAKIQVGEPIPDSDERIIEITTNELQYLETPVSHGINAVLQVQRRIAELLADKDNKEIKSMTAKLLVPTKQIGSLIGKGGSIINEMRKMTRANIRIPPKDERPPCAGENDELVQIVGDFEVVENALIQVLTRLRNNLFKGQDIGSGIPPPLSGFPLPENTPVLSGYGWRHEPGLGLQHPLNYSGYGSPLGAAATGQASFGKSNKESRRRQK